MDNCKDLLSEKKMKNKKKCKKKNKGKCSIFSLKEDNLLHIISYLKEKDKSIFYGICRRLYKLKRLYFHYSLNKEYSHKYCSDKKFRKIVNRRVKHETKRRLDLVINDKDVNYKMLSSNIFENCYKINFSSIFSSYYYRFNLINLKFKGVHTLDLRDCSKITDVSSLGRVHTLNLSRCKVTRDVSMLMDVNDLNLHGCFESESGYDSDGYSEDPYEHFGVQEF